MTPSLFDQGLPPTPANHVALSSLAFIERTAAIYAHPAVEEAAVVARPDEKWGETPCAFVKPKATAEPVTERELIDHCRARPAHFKAPGTVIFTELPKTSTGKIQKFLLREQARTQ